MSKAEKFIRDCTKNYSNTTYLTDDVENPEDYIPWLTPDHALRAMEIAREEIYEWLSYHLDTSKMDVDYKFEVIEELRKAMKDET